MREVQCNTALPLVCGIEAEQGAGRIDLEPELAAHFRDTAVYHKLFD
jgi:hypothetical protein